MESRQSQIENSQVSPDLDHFYFRDLHPAVALGTASDRYAGWIGQIYSPEPYAGRITRRTKTVGGRKFVEEVLPVESVEEYFRHFPVLELDFTFYRPLLDEAGGPTQSYHVLRAYAAHLKPGDRLVLKVPQAVFARKLFRAGRFVGNPLYLHPDTFVRRFYEPANRLLVDAVDALIFEQEYQRKQDRIPPEALASELDAFFSAAPDDGRYHVELRTDRYLAPPVIDVLARHGVGQVLSHWTWLPPLSRQFALSGGRTTNRENLTVIRLMTPRGVRYEDAYAKAHPFNRMVNGMMNPSMIQETATLLHRLNRDGGKTRVIVNNRAGGNAPLIAREIVLRFLSMETEPVSSPAGDPAPHKGVR